MVPFSVFDAAPVTLGRTVSDALRNSLDLARHAERWGYLRFWLAEHHNMPGIASAATAVCIAHVAAGTSTIRIGSGGIMLPNHSPLVIAEQFGTLEALHPGRIDLGIGRAPGTDQLTAHALRRNLAGEIDAFPQDVLELLHYFRTPEPGQKVRAFPGAGLNVPVWVLGSSLYGAQLAAMLGLPYAFASHFAPDAMRQAIAIYRERFRPSEYCAKPYVMLGINIFAAESDREGKRLFTSLQRTYINLFRGDLTPMQPPVDDIDTIATPAERAMLDRSLACTVAGSPETVRRGLERFIADTGADELMITGQIFDHQARLRSYEIVAAIRDEMTRTERAEA